MELALGAMAGLAPKLGDLLMAEYVVQKGLKPDIESLSMELVMMNAALKDASQVPPEQLSEVEKLWARQVRKLSYDMEDVVDDFILRVAGGNSATDATDANVFKKILGQAAAMVKKVKDRHQISDKELFLPRAPASTPVSSICTRKRRIWLALRSQGRK